MLKRLRERQNMFTLKGRELKYFFIFFIYMFLTIESNCGSLSLFHFVPFFHLTCTIDHLAITAGW